VDVALEEQAKVAKEFLVELTAEFGMNATVTVNQVDDDETVEIDLTGSDLGLLIGPKGATLLAIQNLTRTYVHYRTGANNGHVNVDVGGYRQKRTEALVRFAQEVAERVKQTGARTAMEPMSAVDRKVIHDTLGEVDGVMTVSEGEDPRRRVIVLPAAPAV
jgi:spoIIIJ-associated protein